MKGLLKATALAYLIFDSIFGLGQSRKTEWTEVIYHADNFALTAPSPPLPNADTEMPNTTKYSIYLPNNEKGNGLTLRVIHLNQSCKPALQLLKAQLTGSTGGLKQSHHQTTAVDLASIKELSLGENPGLQYQWKNNSISTRLDRQYCVKNNIYAFSAHWRNSSPMPELITRIMDSFRLVKPESPAKQLPGKD